MTFGRGPALRETYDRARAEGYGFFASNVTTPEILVGLVRGAERTDSDVVLQLKRDTAEHVGAGDPGAGIAVVGEYLRTIGESADVGVFLNVDHVRPDDTAFLETCLDVGIPASVMIDASHEPFEENVRITREVRERLDAREDEVLLEAELGTIEGEEGGVRTEEAFYTDPEEAVEFVDRSGCDLLAVSIGTEHGVSAGRDLDLRPELAAEIDRALRDHGLDAPLVVHGASGLEDDQIRHLLETGVCKFNKNTRYQYEYARTAHDFYAEHSDAIVPPEGVEDDRDGFFADLEWSPRKAEFGPPVVIGEIRERIAEVMADLTRLTGSAGESPYADA
ncbi:MAG: class II fructose-bisphosphate aldolase [Haloarculaceae archaeon]